METPIFHLLSTYALLSTCTNNSIFLWMIIYECYEASTCANVRRHNSIHYLVFDFPDYWIFFWIFLLKDDSARWKIFLFVLIYVNFNQDINLLVLSFYFFSLWAYSHLTYLFLYIKIENSFLHVFRGFISALDPTMVIHLFIVEVLIPAKYYLLSLFKT